MKFAGKVGFWIQDDEIEPGYFQSHFVEKQYTGDVSRDNRHWNESDKSTISNYRVNNEIYILSDLYARQNWQSIRYVIWNGVKWKVSSVSLGYPRCTLVLSEVYNGE